jgi:hypothetical protein
MVTVFLFETLQHMTQKTYNRRVTFRRLIACLNNMSARKCVMLHTLGVYFCELRSGVSFKNPLKKLNRNSTVNDIIFS